MSALAKKFIKNKKKEHPQIMWADQVKFEFGGRFEGPKGQKRKIA